VAEYLLIPKEASNTEVLAGNVVVVIMDPPVPAEDLPLLDLVKV
jgi:hypothetical protein